MKQEITLKLLDRIFPSLSSQNKNHLHNKITSSPRSLIVAINTGGFITKTLTQGQTRPLKLPRITKIKVMKRIKMLIL
jgi:hypothetical protein